MPHTLIYLDNHATTRVDPRVLDAMMPYLTDHYGNASSFSHRYGLHAATAVAFSRERIAHAIGALPEEIIFTSGATESNNIAVLGVSSAYRKAGDHVITSCLEHSSVYEVFEALRRFGFGVTYAGHRRDGQVEGNDILGAMAPRTVFVSLIHANNEIGTINELKTISEMCRHHGVPLHTDASQSVGKIPINVDELGVDLMSISGHKLYAPKGVGALYIRSRHPRIRVDPVVFGGGQELRIRPGTLNVAGIVGLAEAIDVALRDMDSDRTQIRRRRNLLWDRLRVGVPGCLVNGSDPISFPDRRLDGNLNVWFPGVDGMLLLREAKIVAASTGSACSSTHGEPSRILHKLYANPLRALQSIRFGIGRFTTDDDIDNAAEAIIQSYQRLTSTRSTSQGVS